MSKVCKQDRNQRNMEANKRFKCYLRMINSKLLAIPILTALADYSQN